MKTSLTEQYLEQKIRFFGMINWIIAVAIAVGAIYAFAQLVIIIWKLFA